MEMACHARGVDQVDRAYLMESTGAGWSVSRYELGDLVDVVDFGSDFLRAIAHGEDWLFGSCSGGELVA